MLVLGINDGHDASAALLADGKIVAAAQEERFSRVKADTGLPYHAARYCLSAAGITPDDLDVAALVSHNVDPVLSRLKREANFSVADWVHEQDVFWKPSLLENKPVNYYEIFKDRIARNLDEYYDYTGLLGRNSGPDQDKAFLERRLEGVSRHLGIRASRIRVITHETAHQAYAYYAAPRRGPALILTSEGLGDFSNGTVSVADASGRFSLLSHTRQNQLSNLYQYTTLMLGMKIRQHEYKVMGLAPYASDYEIEKALPIYQAVLQVSGLDIAWKERPGDLYFHFLEKLKACRFDGIAGAIQRYLEEMLCEWTTRCLAETSQTSLRFAGGVAQNIKACKRLSELPGVEDIYVGPAAGDASISIGGCWAAASDILRTEGKTPADHLEPLHHVYLGPEYADRDAEAAIGQSGIAAKYNIRRGVQPEEIATLLARGCIIARMAGRMEFGQRALGNRSILADPRNPEVLKKINRQIKFRDFWMPFTPTILDSRKRDYIEYPGELQSPFMTMAFDSTPLARSHLIAAIHPADETIRPQILEEHANPEYHAIIKAFEGLTGVGGVLNTSFNLHGDPIVLSPREAISTFEKCQLDMLLINQTLISRAGV